MLHDVSWLRTRFPCQNVPNFDSVSLSAPTPAPRVCRRTLRFRSSPTPRRSAQALAQELAPADAEIADALAALFDEWVTVVAGALGGRRASGAVRRRAMALVAALEGARTLARAQRTAAPFDAVVSQYRDQPEPESSGRL
jgi:hypothetical protein